MMDRVTLHSSRLAVEVLLPGTAYRGSRFDWTGIVAQVTLDGSCTFCTVESATPGVGTGGIGLCGEFGIQKPVGFDETPVSGRFPKIGVGMLTRPDEKDADFARPYSIDPFPCTVEAGDDRIVMVSAPLDQTGYAVLLTKTVRVDGNALFIEARLENVGERPFSTDEYNHNFVLIGAAPVGPDYVLRFPFPFVADSLPDALRSEGASVLWTKIPETDFYFRTPGFLPAGGWSWELEHLPTGRTMREFNDFPVARCAFWGHAGVISPEIFVDLALSPGETRSWTRRYEFS
jgi:hypothetical protein